MKNSIILIVLATLCLNLSSSAQNTDSIKPLHLGGYLPDIPLKNTYYPKLSDPSSTSALKGKLLILDFWATWCSPCVEAFAENEKLQQAFAGKVQFISIGYEKRSILEPFLKKHYPVPPRVIHLMENNIFTKLFPHTYLPHYVWISPEGRYLYSTGLEEVTATNIQAVLDKGKTDIKIKKDSTVAYNPTRPLLVDGNGGNYTNLLYHSVLTGYIEGLAPMRSIRTDPDAQLLLRAINTAKLGLIQVAYGDGRYIWKLNRTAIEVANPSLLRSGLQGQQAMDWKKKGNAWCYELILPKGSKKNLWTQAKADLSELFAPYDIRIENRLKDCIALVRTDTITRFADHSSKYLFEPKNETFELHGAWFTYLISLMENKYLRGIPEPIIDDTGFLEKVSISLSGNLNSFNGMNKALEKYGLKLVKKQLTIPMLVISDRKETANSPSLNQTN